MEPESNSELYFPLLWALGIIWSRRQQSTGPRSTTRRRKVLVLQVVRRRRRYRLRLRISWLGSWVMCLCVLLNMRLGRNESESWNLFPFPFGHHVVLTYRFYSFLQRILCFFSSGIWILILLSKLDSFYSKCGHLIVIICLVVIARGLYRGIPIVLTSRSLRKSCCIIVDSMAR